VRRPTFISSLCVLACACSATDATVGINTLSDGSGVTSLAALTRVDLGTLGGGSSYAAGISSSGAVVGWSTTSTGNAHAFRWDARGGMVDLGTLPGDESSRAIAIVDGAVGTGAQILGVSTRGNQSTVVMWSVDGTIRPLNLPMLSGFTTASPTDFNLRGDVVGSDAGNGAQHGWVGSVNGPKVDLSANISGGSNEGSANAVSPAGLVLLTTRAFSCRRTAECWRTYLWESRSGYTTLGTPNDDPEANVTGLAMSEGGTVVGWLTGGAASGATPYRWTSGRGFTALEHYATKGGYGYAAAVNASGTIVGADYDPTSNAIVASTWLANGSIVRLKPDDPNPSVAVSVNDAGTIAGWAVISGANHAVIWKKTTSGMTAALTESSPTKVSVRAPSTHCLSDVHSLASRADLFTCVAAADRAP
jgi:probable HAF family extracellular repeat protein